MAPIIPGSAAATFSASPFNYRTSILSCFLAPSTAPLGEGDSVGMTDVLPPSAFWIANTTVDTIKPRAVRSEVIVSPSSRNNVRMRSANVVSSFKSRPFHEYD